MQTLANLSSSRDVLKQVEINQSSLLRLSEFYRSYRDALDFQLTRRAPEMIEALNMMQAVNNNSNNGANATGSFSNPSGQSITSPGSANGSSPLPGSARGLVRRRSVRPSMLNATGGAFGASPTSEAVSQAVIQLKIKVLSYSDR